jgi:RNA polymerase subunit RPABC4/transcription elongation factor Spt4
MESMTHTAALLALLEGRLAQEELSLDSPIAVAELHKRLVPYALCREVLGLATKAEYDLALLRLLDDSSVRVEERALSEAVRRELGSPEPGLAILQRFAASELRLSGTVPAAAGQAGSSASVGPPRASYETEKLAQDRIPGSDDPDFLPEPDEPTPEDKGSRAMEQAPAPLRAGESGAPEEADCIACGKVLPAREGLNYCPACGADQNRWPCRNCGREVERGWLYCAMCGVRQTR